MKKTIKYIMLAFAAVCAVACEKWTEVEQAMPSDLISNTHGEDYYANLRAYRNSDHSIIMGYWQGWGGQTSSLRYSLMGLPDSVDLVSMWGMTPSAYPTLELPEAMQADLKEAHEKKGIKCLMVFIAHSVGAQVTPSWVTSASEENPVTVIDRYTGEKETCTNGTIAKRLFWGIDRSGSNNTAEQKDRWIKATEAYADTLCHIIHSWDFDGFDWDLEIGYSVGDSGDFINNKDQTYAFCKRMREGLGDKIFIVDGTPEKLAAPEACVFFDYFAFQAYNTVSGTGSFTHSSDTGLDQGVQLLINKYSPYLTTKFICEHTIMLESFEGSFQANGNTYWGAANYTFRDGTRSNGTSTGIGTFEGMAMWNPVIDGVQYRKGGMGAYLLNYEYAPRFGNASATYPQTRRAIQFMNPAVK